MKKENMFLGYGKRCAAVGAMFIKVFLNVKAASRLWEYIRKSKDGRHNGCLANTKSTDLVIQATNSAQKAMSTLAHS